MRQKGAGGPFGVGWGPPSRGFLGAQGGASGGAQGHGVCCWGCPSTYPTGGGGTDLCARRDHSGGNAELRQRHGACKVYGSALDAVPELTK